MQTLRSIRSRITFFLLVLCLNMFANATEPLVKAIPGVSMTVSDMQRSIDFYTTVLTFEKVGETEIDGPQYEDLFGVFGLRVRIVEMKLGQERLQLVQYLAPTGRPIPTVSNSNDQWFQHIAIIVSDFNQAYKILRSHNIQFASSGPQTLPDWNKEAAGIQAFYFKDPDGHVLEILAFPPGKGDPKWRKPSPNIFLGIDHTAIVVFNTESSLKFYRDLLGMKIVGTSLNYGPEQERLNNVQGAKLRITTLRAQSGIGVELLEYLSPQKGRPMPSDTHNNDIWHWNTLMVTDQIQTADTALRKGNYPFISPGIVTFKNTPLMISSALMARDPDGHAMLLMENGGK